MKIVAYIFVQRLPKLIRIRLVKIFPEWWTEIQSYVPMFNIIISYFWGTWDDSARRNTRKKISPPQKAMSRIKFSNLRQNSLNNIHDSWKSSFLHLTLDNKLLLVSAYTVHTHTALHTGFTWFRFSFQYENVQEISTGVFFNTVCTSLALFWYVFSRLM